MPGFLTDYTNNKVLDALFGASSLSPPPTLYFGLSKTAAGKSGFVSEPSAGAYARVAVPNDAARFPAAVGGSKSNSAAITFPAPNADWGTVVSVFVADAPTGGNIMAMADLPAPKTVGANAPAPTIAVGALYLSHT